MRNTSLKNIAKILLTVVILLLFTKVDYRLNEIIHVEAGLRTNNLLSPFPEEANRKIITQIANYHFCPTQEGYKMEHLYYICCFNCVTGLKFWILY